MSTSSGPRLFVRCCGGPYIGCENMLSYTDPQPTGAGFADVFGRPSGSPGRLFDGGGGGTSGGGTFGNGSVVFVVPNARLVNISAMALADVALSGRLLEFELDRRSA